MRSPKFNFSPEDQVSRKAGAIAYKVSITRKGMLYFSKEVLEIYDLKGKLIKLYADQEKKAIGWKVVTEEKSLEALKGVRKLNPSPLGTAAVSIASLVNAINPNLEMPIKGLEVRKYNADYLEGEIFYIELGDNVIKSKV